MSESLGLAEVIVLGLVAYVLGGALIWGLLYDIRTRATPRTHARMNLANVVWPLTIVVGTLYLVLWLPGSALIRTIKTAFGPEETS